MSKNISLEHEISMSPEAISSAINLKLQQNLNAPRDLRLYLDGKVCQGFIYGIAFDQKQESDHIFTFKINEKSEESSTEESINLIVDPETFKLVKGSSITLESHEGQTGFLVNNPKDKRFRGKFFRDPNWQQKILERP